MSLHKISQNNSKNSNHRISLTGTYHCNSKLSNNIQFEKYKPLSLFNISENLQENNCPLKEKQNDCNSCSLFP